MAKKRTKADKAQRQANQLEKRVDSQAVNENLGLEDT